MRESGIDRGQLEAWIKAREDELVRDIGELVAIRSVSERTDGRNPFGEGCKKALDKGLEIASRLGFTSVNHENYCGSAVWRGESGEEIGVFGHLDVVPEGTDWAHDPYRMTVKDGLLIGRGVSDNKGPAMAGFYGVKYLLDSGYKPRHTIRLFLGLNEESGMEDVRYYLKHNPMPKFALVPDGSFPVCNGEKGILILELSHPVSERLVELCSGEASNAVPAKAHVILALDPEAARKALAAFDVAVEGDARGVRISAKGVAAHAAFPEGSVSALAKLARALAESGLLDGEDLECVRFLADSFGSYYGEGLDIHFRDKTGYVTHVGGMTEIRDGRLRQNVNIRYPMGITADELTGSITALAEKHGFALDWAKADPPTYIPAENPVVAMLCNLANGCLGTDDPPYAMGFTYARRLTNAVCFGIENSHEENPMPPGHGAFHQPDECVRVDSLLQAARIYALAVYELDQRL